MDDKDQDQSFENDEELRELVERALKESVQEKKHLRGEKT